MKLHAAVLFGILALLTIATFSQQAFAAQMTAILVPDLNRSEIHYTGVRLLEIRYPEGSDIANQLAGRKEVVFTVNGTFNDQESGMAQIIEKVEEVLVNDKKSPVTISDATIKYTARINGRDNVAQVSYKVEFLPTIQNYVLQAGDGAQADVVDIDWRGIVVEGPLIVNSPEHGQVNINQPIGLFQVLVPEIGEKLMDTNAREIMEDPILAFDEFATSMAAWHFLFDPTGSQAGAAGYGYSEGGVVSVFSLGESSFREGAHVAKEADVLVNLDGTEVDIHSQTPPPSGQLQIAGFANIEGNGGSEVAIVSRDAPEGAVAATGGFPIQVLLVLGGMMGAIAIFVLFKARK